MKNIGICLVIFFTIFLLYFAVGTNFTFKPKWTIDYFNPMAKSLMSLRLDLFNPSLTYDLVNFNNKWYIPWGILPSIVLIPLQLLKGKFLPTIYLSVFFASLNVVFFYLILRRIKSDFLPALSKTGIFFMILLFSFGTTNFYVGTIGSSWQVEQMTTAFLGTVGIFIIFKKNRKLKDYLLSSLILSAALIGRPTVALLISFPMALFFFDHFPYDKATRRKIVDFIKTFVLILCIPLVFFLSIFFSYNYLRFNTPLEYGFSYIKESPYLREIRERNGNLSIKNIPNNVKYMVFEIPSFSLNKNHTVSFNFNLNGNSIFFLTPPLLTIFLTIPLLKDRKRNGIWQTACSLWLAMIITIFPSLLHYSTGWMQFGYRYALDIIIPMMTLSVFGIRGKLGTFYVLGIIFSMIMYYWGIRSLY